MTDYIQILYNSIEFEINYQINLYEVQIRNLKPTRFILKTLDEKII
jgi:hypothetical protein